MSTRSELIELVERSVQELEGRITDTEAVKAAGEDAVRQAAELGLSDSAAAVFQAVIDESDSALVALNQLLSSAQNLLEQLSDDS